MDELFRALLIFMHWRVLLVSGIALFTGGSLAYNVDWVSGPQGIAFFLFGVFAGLAWNEHAWSHKNENAKLSNDAPQRTSLPVAILTSAIGGAIWGALSRQTLGSALFGLLLLLAVLGALYFWRSSVPKPGIPLGYAVPCLLCGLACYAFAVLYGSKWLSDF
jgi:hypothetical protein